MFQREDNGDVILAYNPSSNQRNPLCLASSADGVVWSQFATLAHNASVQESCMCCRSLCLMAVGECVMVMVVVVVV